MYFFFIKKIVRTDKSHANIKKKKKNTVTADREIGGNRLPNVENIEAFSDRREQTTFNRYGAK